MEPLSPEFFASVFKIVLLDLVLSGDNALVIGLAARALSPKQQRQAIFFGAAGAIGLRVMFTGVATVLLGIPFLMAIGGLVLVWIAVKLLSPQESHRDVKAGTSLWDAIRTIVVADVVMSLDNVLSVAGAAHGSLGLLVFGLLLSMPIILFGSGLVAALLNRFTWLVYVAVGVLVHTAVVMVIKDPLLSPYFPHDLWFELGVTAILCATVILPRWLAARRAQPAADVVAEPLPVLEPVTAILRDDS